MSIFVLGTYNIMKHKNNALLRKLVSYTDITHILHHFLHDKVAQKVRCVQGRHTNFSSSTYINSNKVLA